MTVDEALEAGTHEEHVIVIGITGHKMKIAHSGQPSVYEIIGLLTRAQNFMVYKSEEDCDCGK